jgi:hypothetical protein
MPGEVVEQQKEASQAMKIWIASKGTPVFPQKAFPGHTPKPVSRMTSQTRRKAAAAITV